MQIQVIGQFWINKRVTSKWVTLDMGTLRPEYSQYLGEWLYKKFRRQGMRRAMADKLAIDALAEAKKKQGQYKTWLEEQHRLIREAEKHTFCYCGCGYNH